MSQKQNRIVVAHTHLDPDACVGVSLLIEDGEEKFPGISDAMVTFWSGGEEFNKAGFGSTNVLTVDIGGGMFDHHPANKHPGECAATLVAKHLGISEKPELQKILDYTKAHDLHGTKTPLDFADFLQCLNKKYSDERGKTNDKKVFRLGEIMLKAKIAFEKSEEARNPRSAIELLNWWMKTKKLTRDDLAAGQIVRYLNGLENGAKNSFDFAEIIQGLTIMHAEVSELAFELLNAKYERQKALFGRTLKDLDNADVIEVKQEGKKFVIVTGKSDEEDFGKMARSKQYGYIATIVIQRNSNGRTMIFTNNRYNTVKELRNIVAMIRLEEQLKQGKKPFVGDFWKLSQPGRIEEVPNWYFQQERHKGGGKLLNGSLTSPDIPPTQIPLWKITRIVETALNLGQEFDWGRWITVQIKRH